MEDYLKDAKWVCGFEKPSTDPSAFERPATTVLSPYLKFGCLSPRLFHSRLLALYRAAKGAHSKPPVSLRGQLLWREFFYTVSVFCGVGLAGSWEGRGRLSPAMPQLVA